MYREESIVSILKEVKCGEIVRVKKVDGEGVVCRCIMDMGIIRGCEIYVCKVVLFGDFVEVIVCGYELLFRKVDVEMIIL